jgi:hypothetical protein
MTINLDDGLVGYWALNESSGTVAEDWSGSGNDGALQNTDNSNWVDGIVGNALELNGTDEYVDCSINTIFDISEAITISAWINTTSSNEWIPILCKDKTSAWAIYRLILHNGYPCAHIGETDVDADNELCGASPINDGRWHHVLMSYDKHTLEVRVDNELVNSDSHIFSLAVDASTGVTIGSFNGYPGNIFAETTVDEIRIYSRELNDGEKAYLYHNPGGSPIDSPSARIMITDRNGDSHGITDISELEITTELSDATDAFSFSLLNDGDAYSYIEKGCATWIATGMGGNNTKKIVGFVTEVEKTLDDDGVKPVMSVSGEDGGIRLNHIYFSKRFYDKEISVLVKAILDATDYTTGKTYRALADVSTNDAYIEATAYSIDEASYVWKSLGAAIKELADAVGFAWYRDIDKVLHFFDPAAAAIADVIVDADLEGPPTITDVGEIVNRAVVIGGYQQSTDRTGNTKTTTTTVTVDVSKNQSFVPTEDYLSSVLVYTELVADSASDLTISIQSDSAAAPDGVNLPNGQMIIKLDSITDAGYTEFRFKNNVTLTPGETYWIVLKGTTSDGVKVGVDGGAVLDYVTRYPVRVAIMTNDDVSQERYANSDGSPGIYMQVFKDEKIEDPQLAEIMANEMLMPEPKKVVSLTVRGDSLKAGDVVQLTISETGIAINKTMKILSSTQTLGERFIYNELELEEI